MTGRRLLASALLVGAGASTAVSAQVMRQQYVEVTAVVESEPLVHGATVRAAVEFRIGAGYHVNANPPSEDWLIATEVTVSGAPGVAIERVFYPEAEEKTFAFWPEPLRVYEGSVAAGVILRVDPGAEIGPHDLQFTVEYQACNDEACFAPNTVSTKVPVTVATEGTPARTLASPLLQRARFEDDDR